jgi:hypothetical protein
VCETFLSFSSRSQTPLPLVPKLRLGTAFRKLCFASLAGRNGVSRKSSQTEFGNERKREREETEGVPKRSSGTRRTRASLRSASYNRYKIASSKSGNASCEALFKREPEARSPSYNPCVAAARTFPLVPKLRFLSFPNSVWERPSGNSVSRVWPAETEFRERVPKLRLGTRGNGNERKREREETGTRGNGNERKREREETGTRGNGNERKREREETGTRGNGNERKREREETGTRGNGRSSQTPFGNETKEFPNGVWERDERAPA